MDATLCESSVNLLLLIFMPQKRKCSYTVLCDNDMGFVLSRSMPCIHCSSSSNSAKELYYTVHPLGVYAKQTGHQCVLIEKENFRRAIFNSPVRKEKELIDCVSNKEMMDGFV